MVRSPSRILEFCQSNSIIWYSLSFLKKYLHPVIKFGPHLYQYARQFRFLNLVNLLFFVVKLLDSNKVLFQYLDNLLRNYYYKPWNIPYIACRKITFRSFIQSWSHYWCCRKDNSRSNLAYLSCDTIENNKNPWTYLHH